MTTATHHDLISPRIEERLRRGRADRGAGRGRFAISSTRSTATCSTTASSPTTPTRAGSATGKATDAELVHFVRQFSVFSNQFLVAALLRVINAPTLQQARSAKEILMNELGVIYRRTDAERGARAGRRRRGEGPRGRPRAGQHRGDGRRRHLPVPRRPLRVAARRRRGARAGLRRPGQAPARPAVRRSTSATSCSGSTAARTTRSPRGRASPSRTGPPPASGRSSKTACCTSRQPGCPRLKVAFFTWHNRVEAQHAGHTMEELEDVFFDPEFDETRFFQGAPRGPRRHRRLLGRPGRRPARGAVADRLMDGQHAESSCRAQEATAMVKRRDGARSASTTCGCSWAMRGSRPTSTATRSASR